MQTDIKGVRGGYERIMELGKYNRNITGESKCYKWPNAISGIEPSSPCKEAVSRLPTHGFLMSEPFRIIPP